MLSNDTDYAERLHTTSDEAQLVGAALLEFLYQKQVKKAKLRY